MDQTQGPARYHTHFYDVVGADHGGVARRHGLLPAPMTPQELQEQPALLRARGHSHRDSVLMPALSPTMTEGKLARWLKQDRVLWLDHGYLEGDDTDAHIDTLARLAPDDAIVFQACDDESDSHYAELKAMADEIAALRAQREAPALAMAADDAHAPRDRPGRGHRRAHPGRRRSAGPGAGQQVLRPHPAVPPV